MAINLFGKGQKENGKKGYLAVPENMYDAPFADIIACMDPRQLEDAVAYAFDDIVVRHREADDFRYLRQFPSWVSLFGEKLEEIMYQHLEHLSDFKKILEYFPEFTTDVYEFLIETYIHKETACFDSLPDEINIIDDILIPISDLEKYQNYHFNVIRDRAIEMMDAAETYTEMWDILWAYETYFDMPREQFNEFIQEIFQDFVNSYDEYDSVISKIPVIYTCEDYAMLSDFFRDAEGYWYFMDHLPILITSSGLDMYTMMIKILGPVKEVLALHDYCAEFLPPDTDVSDVIHIKD